MPIHEKSLIRPENLEVETAVLPNHRGAAGEDLAIDSVLLGNPEHRSGARHASLW